MFFSAINKDTTAEITEAVTRKTPPVVGVPHFCACVSGASSLMYCPSIFFSLKSLYKEHQKAAPVQMPQVLRYN